MVTIHMVASLDGFIAQRDGGVEWLNVTDTFDGGEPLTPEAVEQHRSSVGCYVMGSRTYQAAVAFDGEGLGWPYGETPVMVLTHRQLAKVRDTIEFHAGDLARVVNEVLAPRFNDIWFVGGAEVCAECLRLGLADEVRCSILPVAMGDGLSFFEGLGRQVPLHLLEVKSYDTGMVTLRYEVRKP